jgi:hypothetical protein
VATNERRRQRYATDEDYRERKLRASREKREQVKLAKEAEQKLAGWQHISSVPDEHYVMIHDPDIWGVILAYHGHDGHWHCLHYSGPEPRPTHWRYMPRLPEP